MTSIMDKFGLKNKTAFVTRSSRGLGAGLRSHSPGAGASVALHGSRAVPESILEQLRNTGATPIALKGDVSKADVCEAPKEQFVKHFGVIDILVNNGGMIRRGPAIDHTADDWQTGLDTNLSNVFHLSRYAAKHMLKPGLARSSI